MKNKKPVIILKSVTKKYLVHHEKPTLSERIISETNETFVALNNINLTITEGESVGIVGANGSGKTTLLKIIAGIATPSRGSVCVTKRLVSLIDLTAGFHPELSGERNVYLNGMLIGMKKQLIDKKMPSIIHFADIGNFIDAPLYTYSDGMKLRLGFAIAVAANPDILILDEGISVGDLKFQFRSQQYLETFLHAKKILIAVEHKLDYIQKYCSRILIMRKGTIIADGDIKQLGIYRRSFFKRC
ncbi:ABC transporter ATP-binding protein [Candidatus Gottesmanbacteria bacterium]|nr:ABC transporter ATP-binding protein [Candidatus Gottesmanbacteria bacterium]